MKLQVTFQYLPDVSLICLNCDTVVIPFDDAIHDHLLLDLVLFDIILVRDSTADLSPPIVMSSPRTVAILSPPLDVASPHARARTSPRQFQAVERRCQLLFPILCSVACAVQTVSQLPAHVFVTWLEVVGWQFDKHVSSR